MTVPLPVSFVGGANGEWRVERIEGVTGDPLAMVDRLAIREGPHDSSDRDVWVLRGTTSNLRYTRRAEADDLASRQDGLGRPGATRAALIPIRKSASWWGLAQDERRAIFEESSKHIAIGLEYLPAIARRLHHGRDLAEPFDFLTWFEFAPDAEDRFEDMVRRLRGTPEWRYVEREVDIRLSR